MFKARLLDGLFLSLEKKYAHPKYRMGITFKEQLLNSYALKCFTKSTNIRTPIPVPPFGQ